MPSQVPRTFVATSLPAGTAHLVLVRSKPCGMPELAPFDSDLALCDADGSTGADRSGSSETWGAFPSRFRPNRPHEGPIPEIGNPGMGRRPGWRYVGRGRLLPLSQTISHVPWKQLKPFGRLLSPLPSAASIRGAVADHPPQMARKRRQSLLHRPDSATGIGVQLRLQEANACHAAYLGSTG